MISNSILLLLTSTVSVRKCTTVGLILNISCRKGYKIFDSERIIGDLIDSFGFSDNDLKAARGILLRASEMLSDTSSSFYKRVRFILLRLPANYSELKPAFKQEYTRFLLEFLNISQRGLYGKLKVAIIKGQLEELKILLRFVDTVPKTPMNDESLAIYAFGRWNKDVRKEILEVLIEKGLDTSVRDETGWNLLHKFLWFFFVGTDDDLLDVTKILVRSGVSLNDVEERFGRTPLHIAVQGNMTEVISFFIQQEGIDVNARSKSGSTALHFAAIKELETVKRLLEKKYQIDVNARDNNGYTPYHLAKMYNHRKEVAEYLLRNGADQDVEIPTKSPKDKQLMEKVIFS